MNLNLRERLKFEWTEEEPGVLVVLVVFVAFVLLMPNGACSVVPADVPDVEAQPD